MFLHICLSLLLLPYTLCSVSAGRFARNDNPDAAPQKRAQLISDNRPSSLNMVNISAMDVGTVPETLLGHNYGVVCRAATWGTGLEARDCFSALSQSPRGEIQESWGLSDPSSSRVDVKLPVVLFSGRHSTNDNILAAEYLHVMYRRRNLRHSPRSQESCTRSDSSGERVQCD